MICPPGSTPTGPRSAARAATARRLVEASVSPNTRRAYARTGTLELTLPGNPALLAESPIQMQGWGSSVDGPWIVSRASHVVTGSSGYTTRIAADTAPPLPP